jgi:hypothetical protein
MRLNALHKLLHDKGANDGGGIGMGQVVTAAYHAWAQRDPRVHGAIASSCTGHNDACLFGGAWVVDHNAGDVKKREAWRL